MPKSPTTRDAFGEGVTPRLVEPVILPQAMPTPTPAPRPTPKPKRAVPKPVTRAPVPSAIITPAPALAPNVDALAASLGVTKTPGPAGPAYHPDSFVRAVQVIHDTLSGVRAALIERQAELDTREKALRARERAVEARECQVAGLAALAPILAAHGAPEPTGWRRYFRR